MERYRNPKHVKLLEIISRRRLNMLTLSKATGFHYPYLISLLKRFQSDGIIEDIFSDIFDGDREKFAVLTQKGKAMLFLLTMQESLAEGKIKPEKILKWA